MFIRMKSYPIETRPPMQTLETPINTTGSSSKGYGWRWEQSAIKGPPIPHPDVRVLHRAASVRFRLHRHGSLRPFRFAQDGLPLSMPTLGLLRQNPAAPAASKTSAAGLHSLSAASLASAWSRRPPSREQRAAALEAEARPPPPFTCRTASISGPPTRPRILRRPAVIWRCPLWPSPLATAAVWAAVH